MSAGYDHGQVAIPVQPVIQGLNGRFQSSRCGVQDLSTLADGPSAYDLCHE
jgi:hypothetical protein